MAAAVAGEHRLGEFEEFIDEQIAGGHFRDRDEVIRAGLKLLRDRDSEETELRAAIQAGLDDLKSGRYVELKTDTEKQRFFGDLINEARCEMEAR